MASGGMTDVQREGDGGLGSWNPALRPNSGIGEPSHAPENETVEEVIVSEKHGVDTGDELSYAWEQEARKLDHDRQLPKSQSNSFPEVPPLNATESFCFPQQLPQSQAEDVMEVVEEPWNPANHNFTGEDDDGTPDYFGDSGDGGAHDFYTEINGFQGDVLGMPGDDEARFEEGLPLMPSEPKRTSSIQNELDWTEQTAASGMEELSSDVSSHLPTSESPVEETPSFKPQPLDRKTTSQVLGSLHYASENDSPLGESFDVPELVDAYPPGHNDATVVPENLGEPVSTVEDSTTLLPAEQPASDHDQDLAALWEAAMGDDDLLEEDPSSVDPSTFFEDDGAGFLEDGSHEESAAIQLTQSSQSAPPESTSGPSLSNFAPSGFTVAPTQPMYNSGPTSSQRPGMLGRAQSYADKSKGGYTSPYDLPMDLRRPKKRINVHQVNPGPSSPPFPPRPPPPPRSSSMQSQRPTPQVASSTHPATSHVPPSTFTPPVAQAQVTSPSTVVPSLKPKASNSSFFEELPIVAKVRTSSSVGRSTPQPTQTLLPLPPQVPPQGRHTSLPSTMQRQNSNSYRPSSTYQLLPPERIDPYANVPHQAPTTVPVPAIATRYSPAPPSQGMVPTGRNRYATPPTNASRAPPPQTLPFQPRTSSPLAHSGSSAQKLQRFSEIAAPAIENEQALQQEYSHRNASEDSTLCQPGQTSMGLGLAHPYHSEEEIATAPGVARSLTRHSTSPAINSRYAPSSNSQSQPPHHARIPSLDDPQAQRASSEYHPQRQSQGLLQDMGFDPPKRSQTISPGAIKGRPDLHTSYREPYQRPASSNDHALQPPATSAYSIAHVQAAGRAKGFSQNQDYIQPSDGREFDPLERWKGSPILAFGFGGTVVTTFPKRIPRYSAGQTMPMLKCSPGEIKVGTDKVFPLDELIASFPGPLRSKGKKKDVLEWLRKRIQTFEIEYESIAPSPALPDPLRRHGEKVMLWQILFALVEHDGVIEGNPAALDTVRKIFSPELSADNSSDQTSDGADSKLIGISRSDGMKSSSDPVDSGALEVVRTALLKGEREKAVWLAVDKRLWAHAMLISSTMSKDIWKQVVQEFVRNEVKPFGDNTESLAALYEVFAGNWEGSIDELVPPSARAGLQMVSKAAGPGPTRNALDGLDRWRETLSLILSNRSPGDAQALVALGQLLAGYGRIEAAHICYIFAKPQGVFSGVHDSQLGVSLLGAGESQQTFEQSHDLDSLLLTEVYEFALSVLTPSAVSTVSPHLQSYKLYHAMVLAEYGYRSEAQQYCDTITATLKSTTKPSPYYHSQLFSALDELTNRLKQAPKDGSASWISKPSMEKVSGSVWARFNSFVAGEDSDPASVGSGKGVDPGAGPFAKITGDSPTISRSPSASDLYSYSASAGVVPIPASGATISNSRYAPSGTYTPRSSLEQPGRSSQDSPRPMPYEVLKPPSTQRPSSYQPNPTDLYQQPGPDVYKSKSQASVYSPPTNGYLPTPPSQPEYMPIAPPEEFSTTLDQQDSCQPSAPMQQPPFESVSRPLHESSPYSSYEPPRPSQDSPASNTYQPPSDASEPHSSSGYEPPSYDPLSSNGYDPPSYNPETQEDEASPTQEKPKKKSFMDDDEDDFATRAAAILKKEKAQKDRAADEAFRKAAEADAKKDPHPGAKKGWLGGWFGGKKEADMSSSSAPASGPIRAKLGEENSFYYDTQLKKWINKKAGASTETVARATPPPPRSVPSAGHESGISKPPPIALPSSSGPPSGTSTPARSESPAAAGTGGSSLSGEGRSSLAPPLPVSGPPSGPPSSPPSRPSTAMRTDSSIDDLIGAPQARKGGTIKKGKKGRGYVDVMAAK